MKTLVTIFLIAIICCCALVVISPHSRPVRSDVRSTNVSKPVPVPTGPQLPSLEAIKSKSPDWQRGYYEGFEVIGPSALRHGHDLAALQAAYLDALQAAYGSADSEYFDGIASGISLYRVFSSYGVFDAKLPR